MVTDSDDSCRMFPEAHAWEVVSAPEVRNVPDVEADQMLIAVMVSEVPPLVHCGLEVVMVTTPLEAVPKVIDTRVVLPTETEVVPAVPGAAV